MKLRILGDRLRLRVTRSEVERLQQGQRVEEACHFGGSGTLRYALIPDPASERIEASFDGACVAVRLPSAEVDAWASSDRVGLEATQTLDRGSLAIAVEKDFQCLIPRGGGQDTDAFPNPRTIK